MHYNLVNEYLNGKMNITEPKVGMCATMFCGSDRWPYVVTEVISPNMVRLCQMEDIDYEREKDIDKNKVEWLRGYFMSKYTKVNDDLTSIIPRGEIFTLRKNGRWIEKGHDAWGTGAIMIGAADLYRDPNF